MGHILRYVSVARLSKNLFVAHIWLGGCHGATSVFKLGLCRARKYTNHVSTYVKIDIFPYIRFSTYVDFA